MKRKIIALLYDPWPKTFDSTGGLAHRMAARLRKSIFSRANPRSAEYMHALCKELWADAEIVTAGSALAQASIPSADVVVILYPDAIGQGFASVESDVARLKRDRAEIRVLNGRRRDFPLSPVKLTGLRQIGRTHV